MIEDILPFVLNTKRPLSDIWLLSYKQNSFGCFLTKVRISRYFLTQIGFSLLVSLNLWLTISLKLNFFRKWKVLDTRILRPKNFSKRDQVDYLTVDTLSPVGTWKSWNSSVALLSLTCYSVKVPLFNDLLMFRKNQGRISGRRDSDSWLLWSQSQDISQNSPW